MSGKIVLDTNIVIALFAQETAVEDRFLQTSEIFLPSIVIGELYFGAYKSQRIDANLQRITEFAKKNVVLVCDQETAQIYGSIKRTLHAKGKPLPENDIWIAALALQYDLPLATRDDHFQAIPDLRIENW